ncbi:hypothetical protein, partial [Thiolapillus sp.]
MWLPADPVGSAKPGKITPCDNLVTIPVYAQQVAIEHSPHVAPESGIFPERFLPRLFERTKVDVIHRLAGRSGKLGEKIP